MAMLAEKGLDAPGSCLQYCPCPGLQHCIALGTYQLHEDSQTRTGDVSVYCLDAGDQSILQAARVETPGVFDLSWSSTHDQPLLATGLADGRAQCFSLILSDNQLELRADADTTCFEGSMVACVDFNRAHGGVERTLVVSSSDGKLGMVQQVSPADQHQRLP